MAKTHIMPCRGLGAICRYIRDGRGHTEGHPRILTAATNGCTLFSAENDMSATIKIWNKEKRISGYLLLVSYGENELCPDTPKDVEKGLEHCIRLCEKIGGKNRQFLIIGQADGAGHKLHFHAVICNVDMQTGKCLRGRKTSHDLFLAQKSDEILEEMGIRNRNAEIDRHRSEKIISRTEKKLVEKGEYSWMSDFRQRYDEAMRNKYVMDDDSFQNIMALHGILVRFRGSKKTASGKAVSYDFIDESGKKRKMRGSTLGTDYQYEHILEVYEKHRELERKESAIQEQYRYEEILRRRMEREEKQKQ